MATGKTAMPEFAADLFTGTDDRRKELWIQTAWPIGFLSKTTFTIAVSHAFLSKDKRSPLWYEDQTASVERQTR